MKKYLAFLCFTACLSGQAVAQIDNLSNLSAEWTRIGSRTAATDAPDIMMYNPAGMAFMGAGLHIGIGNQSYFRKPSHVYDLGAGPMKYEQDGNDLFVPNLNIGYTKDKWSVFGAVYIAGGGATADYPNGSINTDLIIGGTVPGVNALLMTDYTAGKDAYLKGSSYYLTAGIGGAYAFNDKVSAGVLVRDVIGKNKTEAGFTLTGSMSGLAPDVPLAVNTTDDASGIGVVASLHVKPVEKLALSFRYETNVTLDFETTVDKDDVGIFANGEKNRRDLPAVAALGIAVTASDKLRIYSDWNYYFQKNADWGPADTVLYYNTELSVLAGNAYTFSLGFEYDITDALVFSLGGVYSKNDIQDRDGYYTHLGAFETVMESNVSVCTGFAYDVNDKVRVNLGVFHAFYPEKTVKALYYYPYDVDVKINNSITSVGVGASFRL